MNYSNPENHRYRAAINYADPIAKFFFPISFAYGILYLISSGSLKTIFESGIMENIAALTLQLAFASLLIFAGLTSIFLKSASFLFRVSRKCAGYCSAVTISMSSAILGITSGLIIPYAIMNGVVSAIALAFLVTLLTVSLGFVAHRVGIGLYVRWPGYISRYKAFLGVGSFLVGIELFVLTIFEQWVVINSF